MSDGQFQILFLGDSVVWGQGLTDDEKFSSKLVAWINQFHPDKHAFKTVLAHSGAIIGVSAKPGGAPSLHGEVPSAYPTILDQCDLFQGSTNDVDLVVLNGGINDVGVQYIFNAFTDQDELADTIQRYCRIDLTSLLLKVAARFTNHRTQIIVTGYFPVLSSKSDPLRVPTMLPLFGISLPALLSPFNPIAKIVSNSLTFWRKSQEAMSGAVADANAKLGTDRIVFAEPGFTESNAAFAPSPWIFAVNADLSPQDDVIASRAGFCRTDEPDLVQRELCFRASAGHPNKWGANEYFNVLFPILQKRYGF